jgi:hypothetical protein
MGNMPTSEPSATDLLPDTEVNRYGLKLTRASFDKLGQALDRISDAERSAEIAASTLRVF